MKNEKIGSIYFANSGEGVGGFCCENAVSNTGVYYTAHNKKNTSSYGKGVALFGAGEVLLNVHYDVYYGKRFTVVIGNDDKNSFGNITMQIDQADIYSISNDSENKIYVVYNRKNQKGSDYAIFAGSKSRIVSEVVNTAELSQRFLHGDIAEYGSSGGGMCGRAGCARPRRVQRRFLRICQAMTRRQISSRQKPPMVK